MTDKSLQNNTYVAPQWTVSELVAAKRGRTVGVVIPALNEEKTVAGVIESIRPYVGSLVDDLVLIDSGSTDRTMEIAQATGARVVSGAAVLTQFELRPGKGEVLWRSLAATDTDLIAFIDSDLVDPDPQFVPRLLGPLILRSDIHLVKGFYRRPLIVADREQEDGGGRVTELVARPLLSAVYPDLGFLVQPLSGEYAATRELLTRLPFAAGYGVEIAMLLDAAQLVGTRAIAQVDLGVRRHRNRELTQLGVMSRQIIGTVLRRVGVTDSSEPLQQFFYANGGLQMTSTEVLIDDRPPLIDILDKEY